MPCSKGRRKARKRTVPWWSEELTKLHRKAANLDRAARRQKTEEARTLASEARSAFKKEVRRSKRRSWKDFASDMTNTQGIAKFVKSVFRNREQAIGFLKDPEGRQTESREEVVELLFDTFFKDSVGEVTAEGDSAREDQDACVSGEPEVVTFDRRRVGAAIASFGNYKAPGPDGFKPIVLKHLDDLNMDRLCFLFEGSLRLGYVPRRWRLSRTIFIPKPGKDSYDKARAFRPISLTSFLFKTMERVVGWWLEDLTSRGQVRPLHAEQYAFRRGRGTDTALARVVDMVEATILRGQFALGVFLDIEGLLTTSCRGKPWRPCARMVFRTKWSSGIATT